MENMNLTMYICLMIPMSMMLLVFKGRSRMLCGFLMAGMFVCVLSGEINGLLTNVYQLDEQMVAVNFAPLVEEIAKAIPIVFISFLLRPKGQELAEYALAIGVGFATMENVCVLMETSTVSFGYAVLRAIGAGVLHGVCTLIVGLAMRTVITEKAVFFSGTLAALSIAVIYHSIYNMLITSRYMAVGVVLPLVTFVALLVGSYRMFKKRNQKNSAETE